MLALWLAIGQERVRSGLLLAASTAPAILVGAWAFTRPALTEDVAARSDRVADGTVFGVLALVGAVIVAGVVAFGLRRTLEPGTRRRVGRGLIALVIVIVVGAGAAVSVSAADALSSSRDCAEVANDPSRLGSLDPNLRLCWWDEALEIYSHHGPEGAGAGTFEVARKRFRQDARNVVQPHSVPLQHLADGGVAGLGLFVALVLAAAVACICALRRLSGTERAAAAALVAAPAAYVVHALVDYNWDFLAVTAPTMLALGVLAGAGRDSAPGRRRPLAAVGVILVAAVVLVSFSFPRLADRAERDSTRELAAGESGAGARSGVVGALLQPAHCRAVPRSRARRGARRVVCCGRARVHPRGRAPAAEPGALVHAGVLQFDVRDNMCAAYRYLNEAYTLDPVGNQWVDGGPLDVARDAVDAGGCALGS